MKLILLWNVAFLAATVAASSHSAAEERIINVDTVDYNDGDFALKGFVSIPKTTPAPAVVIIPDWSNVDDYEKTRATMMNNQLGWVGFAADIYGPEFSNSDNQTMWREQYMKYRFNNTLMYSRIQAAIDVVKNHPDVISDKVAIIGYCFGGTGILTYSFLSATEPSEIVGAVSFHGGLGDFPVSGAIKHPVLVLSGGDDDASTAVEDLENKLVSANSTWQITRYSGVEHAFTKWSDDRYNELVDHRSWHEMSTFLQEKFGEMTYENEGPTSDAVAVDYENNGFALKGYLSIPESAVKGKTPAVVIVPAWGGNGGIDGYEAQRATLLATQNGYVAFVADIYGVDMQTDMSFDAKMEQATKYRTDYQLFVSRIQEALDIVANHELVNAKEIAMIGYCFGGTGVVDFAFAGKNNVKAVVPFHGGLTSLSPVETDDVQPYMLIQSGGSDDAHGNTTELENQLNMAKAEWEVTRYSDVLHGFTHWGVSAYNARADWRSWNSMSTLLSEILVFEDIGDATMTEDLDSTAVMEVTMAPKEVTMAPKEDTMAPKEDTMAPKEDTMAVKEDDSGSMSYFVGNAAGFFAFFLTVWFC